jgi:deoxyribonuclease V
MILVDAHGRLHPRRAGLATIVGVLMERPTVGIAKSRLTGEVRGEGMISPVFLRGKVEGLCIRNGKEFYVSPGNMISLDEIKKWLESRECKYPEELVEADARSKALRATSESVGLS